MFLPRSQNTVAINNQITLLNLHYSSCRLVTFLKITDDNIHVSDICKLSVRFKIITCSFHIFLLFVPEMSTSLTSYIVVMCHMYRSMHVQV